MSSQCSWILKFIYQNYTTSTLYHYKRLLCVKSNLWSSQAKTIEFYSYSKYLFRWKMFYPVQYFTRIVSVLAIFGQFFVYIFSRQATYLRYIWQHILSTFVIIICTVHPLSQCISPFNSVTEANMSFVSVIWVEHPKGLRDWGCESCAWIVWQYLIGFFVWYFLDLDYILFAWTICLPVYCLIKPFL